MIINAIKKPFKIFTDINTIEHEALQQFTDTMNHPDVIRGALMPDVHSGYVVPIGCVFESYKTVFPSAVGYDQSCGVLAAKTTFDIDKIRSMSTDIYHKILRNVPVGYNHHKKLNGKYHGTVTEIGNSLEDCSPEMIKIANDKNWQLQLGTLGGGNHFISIDYDEEDNVWVVIHSGSRGVGHGGAEYYMKLASPDNRADKGLHGFHTESKEGQNYIKDLKWCHDFALANRIMMLLDITSSIQSLGIQGDYIESSVINRHHNHAESKDGVHWVHRKGATHAEKGMMGVVPGNMRDGSFIVRGLGNHDSLNSSSHGAGRMFSRSKAKKTLSETEFVDTMQGIVANVGAMTLDESPMAYKNIFDVMNDQSDLVEIVARVKTIINVKG